MIGRLFGWNSPTTVAKIHSVFETLETSALAVAILLEVILGLKKGSDAAWVILAIVDGVRRVYGWRDSKLTEIEKKDLLEQLEAAREQQSVMGHLVGKLRLDQADRATVFNITRFAGVLESRAKASVDIMYPQGVGEAEDLARAIEIAMVVGGWHIAAKPHPIPLGKSDLESPISQIGAASTGVTILITKERKTTDEAETAFFWALRDAFREQGTLKFTWDVNGPSDPPIPAGTVWVVVGPKS